MFVKQNEVNFISEKDFTLGRIIPAFIPNADSQNYLVHIVVQEQLFTFLKMPTLTFNREGKASKSEIIRGAILRGGKV